MVITNCQLDSEPPRSRESSERREGDLWEVKIKIFHQRTIEYDCNLTLLNKMNFLFGFQANNAKSYYLPQVTLR